MTGVNDVALPDQSMQSAPHEGLDVFTVQV